MNWIKDNEENRNNRNKNKKDSNHVFYLLGNLIDEKSRVISKEKSEENSKSLGIKYFEVSSKMNMNIPEVMARMIMGYYMRDNHIDNCFKLSHSKEKIDIIKEDVLGRLIKKE